MDSIQIPNECYQNVHSVVSKVAYLIGIPSNFLDNSFLDQVCNNLENNKHARILRNLCLLRASIIKNFGKIFNEMKNNRKTLYALPEYISLKNLTQLEVDGIPIIKNKFYLHDCVIDINKHISDRVNNCQDVIPSWLNWDYIKDLFIMPDGLSATGVQNALNLFYENKSCYPYSVYINWKPSDCGNILLNDEKFVTLLYRLHDDFFTDLSKVKSNDDVEQARIQNFIQQSQKCILVVDCENSNPYKLLTALQNAKQLGYDQISKVVLYDDVRSSNTWKKLSSFIDMPIERVLIERINGNKSLVDIRLATGVCEEYYRHEVDSFIIASSDSDYWALVSSLPDANFLLLVERDKCGSDMKDTLRNNGICYCYLDDFYSGDDTEMKYSILVQELKEALKPYQFNIRDILKDSIEFSRMDLSETEYNRFFDKYIRIMSFTYDSSGGIVFEL